MSRHVSVVAVAAIRLSRLIASERGHAAVASNFPRPAGAAAGVPTRGTTGGTVGGPGGGPVGGPVGLTPPTPADCAPMVWRISDAVVRADPQSSDDLFPIVLELTVFAPTRSDRLSVPDREIRQAVREAKALYGEVLACGMPSAGMSSLTAADAAVAGPVAMMTSPPCEALSPQSRRRGADRARQV